MRDDDPVREPSARHLAWYLGTALHSVGRHRAVALAVVALTLAATAALLAVLPGAYEVRARLVVRNPPLSAPGVYGREDSPPQAAGRMLRAHDELLAIVQDADLVRRWRERRPALSRLKERILSRPATDAEVADGLARTLDDRLWIGVARDGVVGIVVRWPDPDAALALSQAAQRRYLGLWQALEVTSISAVVRVLEQRTEEMRFDVERRLKATSAASGGAATSRDLASDLRDRDARRRALRQQTQREEEAAAAAPRPAQPGVPRTVRSTIDVDTLLRMRALRLAVPLDTTGEDSVAAARADLRRDEDDPVADELDAAQARGVGELDPRSAQIVELARSGAASAEQTYAALSERLENARVELDTSRGAFERRYFVAEPAMRPRATVRPAVPAVLLAALLDALLLAILATTVVELRAVRRAAAVEAGEAPPAGRTGWRGLVRPVVGVGAVGVVCLAGVFAGNGSLALALAPFALAVVGAAAWWFPADETLPVLAFLCLVLENPSEAFGAGAWTSPIHIVGALFLQKISVTIPVKALIFSGLDVALVFLTAALLVHRARRDAPGGRVASASPAITAALVCLATILFVWGYGIVRGGSFSNSLWQVFRVVYMPCVLLLFSAGLRGPVNGPRLARLLVAAALYRAVLAIWIRWHFPDIEEVPFATTHADSMLFVDAVAVLFADLMVRPGRRTFWRVVAIVPVVFWAMVANNRRLAWVELGAAILPMFVLAPWTTLKRRIVQTIVLSIPLIVVYIGVGWGHPTGVFAPVRVIRSVVDSKSDGSTQWRDWENYNIAFTAKQNPIIGSGFGHPYVEVVLLPDISRAYSLYRYAPHNSVLGLVAYAGILGFAGLWMMMPIGILLAVRSYRFALTDRDRVAMLGCIGVIVAYLVHCFGDMGLGTWASVFTVAPAIALAAKAAIATGAWPARSRSSG